MRDLEKPGRSLVIARNGMAATSHPLATLAAVNMLQAGGNAMDAAIAACAVQGVVEPGSTGVGGDCFALYAKGGGGDVIAFNGSGRAPAAASCELYREKIGGGVIPRQSPYAVTVPGAVDAWARLLNDHGSRDLGEVLAPAIRLAEEGYAISERVHADWSDQADLLRGSPNARQVFLPGDEAPAIGSVHHQPALARTLRRIAEHGPDGFYAGPVAGDIVDYLQSLGGVHTLEDLRGMKGEYVTPISSDYRGHRIHECPPNGQGIITLLILKILSGFGADDGPISPTRLHRTIEAARLAYSIRDVVLGDPDFAEVPVEHLLSEKLARDLRGRISDDRAIQSLPSYPLPAHSDTVYLSVVDKERNAASFINSLFSSFGSTLMAPKSGVLLHNRGTSFVLDPHHPNAIEPRKRPMHTIIPGMAVKDGRTVMSFGVMGGHYQALGQAWFISSVLDHGLDMQSAMELPRFFPVPGTNKVEVELTLPSALADALRQRGFDVVQASRPIGGAQAVAIDWDRGVLTGASDHRKDGCALGY